MININYLNNNTSNDKKIIKSQSTTNIDKDFYMEVFSNGKNKLMWRNKFINYVNDDVKDFLLTPSNQEAVFKFYQTIKSKPLIDIKYIEEKKPSWKITPQELKYNRRSLNSYTLPRCNGFTKDPRSTGRCNLGGTNEIKVPLKNIKTLVLGGHGDTMVPMPSRTTVDGKSIEKLVEENKITKQKIDAIIDRTRKGGGEINKLLEKGSAFYAPAASGVEMAESYLKDLKKELPCAVYLNGEYGFKEIYAGVPVIIGKNGVEKIVEINLNDEEKKNFANSVESVKKLFEAAKKIDLKLI